MVAFRMNVSRCTSAIIGQTEHDLDLLPLTGQPYPLFFRAVPHDSTRPDADLWVKYLFSHSTAVKHRLDLALVLEVLMLWGRK